MSISSNLNYEQSLGRLDFLHPGSTNSFTVKYCGLQNALFFSLSLSSLCIDHFNKNCLEFELKQ